jgi:hypothetical protein
MGAWTGLIWRRTGTGGGVSWTRQWIFGSHKMWGISWLAENRFASQEGFWSVQVPSRCTFCGRQIFWKGVQNFFRPNCNTWAFEALQGNERTLLVKVKIVWQKCNKFINFFLIYVTMHSVARNGERRMERRLNWKGSERKRPGFLWDVVLACLKELRKTYKAVRLPSFRAQITTAEFPNTTRKGR